MLHCNGMLLHERGFDFKQVSCASSQPHLLSFLIFFRMLLCADEIGRKPIANSNAGSGNRQNGRMSIFSSTLVGPSAVAGSSSSAAFRRSPALRSYSTTDTEISIDEHSDKEASYSTCTDIWCGSGAFSIYSLSVASIVLLKGYAFLVALVVLYVLGLSHVDLIHTGYVIIFIIFFVSPSMRRDYWRWLVIYTSMSICFLFIWHVAAYRINPSTVNTPPWVVGLIVGPASPPLWYTTFVSNGIILVFSMIQLPQYIDE